MAAQLTVPLVLLENAPLALSYEDRLKAGWSEQALTDPPDAAETLEGALEKLGKYQKQFSPEVFGRLTQEIKNIYQAQGVSLSPLYGQYGKNGEVKPITPSLRPGAITPKPLSCGPTSGP